MNHYYLFATPCSGKTYFRSNYEYYRGLHIVDFDKIVSIEANARSAQATPMPSYRRIFSYLRYAKYNVRVSLSNLRHSRNRNLCTGKSCWEEVLAFLEKQTMPTCVLGRAFENDNLIHDNLNIAAILPPESRHRENVRMRKASSPEQIWGNYSKVESSRKFIAYVADKYNFEIYPSFEIALDNMFGQ